MKIMRKLKFVLIGTCVVMICGCAQQSWNEATRQNTLDKYKAFAVQYPESEFTPQAKERISQLEFEEAQKDGSESAMNAFIKKYPSGLLAEKAKTELEELAFERVKTKNTITACKDFLDKYPASRFLTDVSSRLRVLMFQDVKRKDTIDAYNGFLINYSAGLDSDEVRKRVEQLSYDKAKKSDTLEAYTAFVTKYPKNENVSEAESRIRKLMYELAVSSQSVTAYEGFIKRYSVGVDSEKLRNGLVALRQWEPKKQIGETIVRMFPSWTGRTGAEGTSFEGVHPPTLAADMVLLRKQLEEGADPNLVRIKDMQQQPRLVWSGTDEAKQFKKEDTVTHPTMLSRRGSDGEYQVPLIVRPNPGRVVPVEEGGLTLLEYCKTNKLDEAYQLLLKHGAK
jgi:outer membrane protein assembly factor BamD (BamD/ComL family)